MYDQNGKSESPISKQRRGLPSEGEPYWALPGNILRHEAPLRAASTRSDPDAKLKSQKFDRKKGVRALFDLLPQSSNCRDLPQKQSRPPHPRSDVELPAFVSLNSFSVILPPPEPKPLSGDSDSVTSSKYEWIPSQSANYILETIMESPKGTAGMLEEQQLDEESSDKVSSETTSSDSEQENNMSLTKQDGKASGDSLDKEEDEKKRPEGRNLCGISDVMNEADLTHTTILGPTLDDIMYWCSPLIRAYGKDPDQPHDHDFVIKDDPSTVTEHLLHNLVCPSPDESILAGVQNFLRLLGFVGPPIDDPQCEQIPKEQKPIDVYSLTSSPQNDKEDTPPPVADEYQEDLMSVPPPGSEIILSHPNGSSEQGLILPRDDAAPASQSKKPRRSLFGTRPKHDKNQTSISSPPIKQSKLSKQKKERLPSSQVAAEKEVERLTTKDQNIQTTPPNLDSTGQPTEYTISHNSMLSSKKPDLAAALNQSDLVSDFEPIISIVSRAPSYIFQQQPDPELDFSLNKPLHKPEMQTHPISGCTSNTSNIINLINRTSNTYHSHINPSQERMELSDASRQHSAISDSQPRRSISSKCSIIESTLTLPTEHAIALREAWNDIGAKVCHTHVPDIHIKEAEGTSGKMSLVTLRSRDCKTRNHLKSSLRTSINQDRKVHVDASGDACQTKKLAKTLWATTRINIYEDESKTYEVMEGSVRRPRKIPDRSDCIFVTTSDGSGTFTYFNLPDPSPAS